MNRLGGAPDPMRQLRLAVAALLGLVVFGTAGFVAITGSSLMDGLLMTVTTISTVGYGELVPLESTAAKLFATGLIVVAVLVMAWVVRGAAELVFADTFWLNVGRQRMQRRIKSMRDHVIVAGYGRMGRAVVAELLAEDEQAVVIDRSQDQVRDGGPTYVVGDATRDETLQRAGLARAKALIAVTDSDPTNIMVVLSARALRADLHISARAGHEDAVRKLQRAGANYVLHHHGAGAMHLALAVTHPAVEDVLNQLIPRRGDLDLGQLEVTETSSMVGRTLVEVGSLRFGALVMAILSGGKILVPPPPAHPLQPGDVLIVAGSSGALRELREDTGGVGELLE